MSTNPLKLRAADLDDLSILSSLVQDAILPVIDMAYLAHDRQFVLVANRFRWEAEGESRTRRGERILSGVSIATVRRCQLRGLDLKQRDLLLALLHIQAEPIDDAFRMTLIFAENRAIRLEVDRIDMVLADQGEPWPTPARPSHDAPGKTRR